jgi:hypothetical protein
MEKPYFRGSRGVWRERQSGDHKLTSTASLWRAARTSAQLVYISPEIALSDSFLKLWKDANFRKHLWQAIVVDETHCINGWGEDFDPNTGVEINDFKGVGYFVPSPSPKIFRRAPNQFKHGRTRYHIFQMPSYLAIFAPYKCFFGRKYSYSSIVVSRTTTLSYATARS